MLVPMRAILAAADKYRYGQGAFNMNSVGQIEAAVRILEFPQPLVVVKRKQGQKGLCNLRGDGNCHLTRLKEAEKLHECSCE